MADMPGFGFTYDAGSLGASGGDEARATELYAWQVCLAHLEQGYLEDADNYPDYLVNRDRIVQALGLGMAQGQNAFPLDGQMFVVAVSIQNEGAPDGIELISEAHPRYADVALVVAEQLLRGEDHGMVAQLPNGNLVPFLPPTDPAAL